MVSSSLAMSAVDKDKHFVSFALSLFKEKEEVIHGARKKLMELSKPYFLYQVQLWSAFLGWYNGRFKQEVGFFFNKHKYSIFA